MGSFLRRLDRRRKNGSDGCPLTSPDYFKVYIYIVAINYASKGSRIAFIALLLFQFRRFSSLLLAVGIASMQCQSVNGSGSQVVDSISMIAIEFRELFG